MTDPSTPAPTVVVLDVNETLSDLAPLRQTFTGIGLTADEVGAWFNGVLRDGLALTLLGDTPSFADLAADGVRARVAAARPASSAEENDEAARRVMGAFLDLAPHPDVVPGLRRLAELGCRVVTFSNGSATVARALLESTEAAPAVEAFLSVEDAGVWKPAPGAYAHVLQATDVQAADALHVAVHPWDLAGAARAGMRTAWVNRDGGVYPTSFPPPDLAVTSLTELADRLR